MNILDMQADMGWIHKNERFEKMLAIEAYPIQYCYLLHKMGMYVPNSMCLVTYVTGQTR